MQEKEKICENTLVEARQTIGTAHNDVTTVNRAIFKKHPF